MTSTSTPVNFAAFLTADTVAQSMGTFAPIQLLAASLDHHLFPALKNTLAPSLPFAQQRLFECLEKRWTFYIGHRTKLMHSIESTGDDSALDVVISGGGHCGLRCAVELALLGFRVTVVEKRDEFSRHNILKTWKPTVDDLLSLGFKTFFPLFNVHGLHAIGTREIQLCLLKVCLLLGVRVIYNEVSAAVVEPTVALPGHPEAEKSWRIVTNHLGLAPPPASSPSTASDSSERSGEEATPVDEECIKALALKVGEQQTERLNRLSKVDFFEPANSKEGAIVRSHSPGLALPEEVVHSLPFSALILAEGESSQLLRNLGFDRRVTRYGPAIGVVVNCRFDPSNRAEKALREFVVLRSQADWQQSCLGDLAMRGIHLENMEYMRFSTHFIVATVKLASLVAYGALVEAKSTIRDSLKPCNVVMERLRAFVRCMATAAGVPEDTPFSEHHGINIFDFSCKGHLLKSYSVLASDHSPSAPLVLPIGDSLVNPFWPQGLGVNRGFHSAIDAAWTLYVDRTQGRSEAIAERQAAHDMMMWLPLQAKLINPGTGWQADPLSRYAVSIPKAMRAHQMLTKQELLTPRMLAAIC